MFLMCPFQLRIFCDSNYFKDTKSVLCIKEFWGQGQGGKQHLSQGTSILIFSHRLIKEVSLKSSSVTVPGPFLPGTFLKRLEDNCETVISCFAVRGGSCLRYSSYQHSAILLMEQQLPLPLYLRFFEDTSSLGLNSFLFRLNSPNSHKENLLTHKTFSLLKSGLTWALSFPFQWVATKSMNSFVIDGFQGLFLVPYLPQRTQSFVVLQANGKKKKSQASSPTPLSSCEKNANTLLHLKALLQTFSNPGWGRSVVQTLVPRTPLTIEKM